ncbi:MAG: outer membrane protein assembly factor BamE [Alphaproteobacteria bacterium]
MKKFILSSFLFLCACSADTFIVPQGSMPPQSKINMLEVGASKGEVLDLLGNPSNVSPIDVNTWIYMKSQMKKIAFLKPTLVSRDILVVKFDKEGNVVSINRADITDGKQIIIDEEKTIANEANEQNFFEKAFGKLNPNLAQ